MAMSPLSRNSSPKWAAARTRGAGERKVNIETDPCVQLSAC